jgi:hypothetical protein
MAVTLERSADDTAIRASTIDVAEADLDELRTNVDGTRRPEQATVGDQSHGTQIGGIRRNDAEARESASQFLTSLVGARQTHLSWDLTFRLQGHAHVGPCELIVIASRDRQHTTVVLTVDDWARVRHNGCNCAAAVVAELAIVTPQRLDALIDGQPL